MKPNALFRKLRCIPGFLAGALLCLSGCDSQPSVMTESITLGRDRAVLYAGQTLSVPVEVLPGGASTALEWTSSHPVVATVDGQGLVKAVAKGNTTIKAAACDGSGIAAECAVRVYVVTQPEAVDLGLSVLWADRNIGAASPEEAGEFFSWGELEPKDTYSWSNYRFGNSATTLTKYLEVSRTVDGQTVRTTLDPEDDVAHVILGGKWRMPTVAETEELISRQRIDHDASTLNGVDGRLFTCKVGDQAGAWVFFPFAGFRSGSGNTNQNESGCFWTSQLMSGPDKGLMRLLLRTSVGEGPWSRYIGGSIRPVCDK